MAKVIAVIGASGQQGGSVARALSKDPDVKVRAVVRNPADAQTQALKKECPKIALARADLNNKDSLMRALEGANGCFVVTATPYGDPVETWHDTELKMGKNIIDACKEANISHIVLSTVTPGIKQLQVACTELDTKVEIFEYAKSVGLSVTGVMMGFYYENILTYFKPQKRNSSEWGFVIPLEGLPWAISSVADLGEIVRILFQQKDAHVNSVVPVVAENLTLQQMIDTLNKQLAPATFVDLGVSIPLKPSYIGVKVLGLHYGARIQFVFGLCLTLR
eukprot:GHVU01147191.1.p1 GENE.GHVU01147191.1~~GHVU01147191.1.p1  ORF type:complete len:277 (-),score=31.16 GHVU01147191.1:318-1148(-)